MKPYAVIAKIKMMGALMVLVAGCGGEADGPGAPGAAAVQGDSHPAAVHETAAELYTCGMHPQIVQEGPGTCPVCEMELTPMRRSAEGVVEIDPTTMQNIGVKTIEVPVRALQQNVRTTGRFVVNEQAQHVVTLKIDGWVEQLWVDYEGARVQKGQRLLDLYSPALVATQEEYLIALRQAKRLAGTPAATDAERLLEAARRRLGYWDFTETQLSALDQSGTPQKTVTYHAPASGTVTRKNVTAGQQIRAGEPLLEIVDLAQLWLLADVYEQDLPWVGVGTEAEVTLPNAPGTSLTGRVDYFYDTVDPATRIVQARIRVPNPGRTLKPGMYATVTLRGTPAEAGPVVPEEAVLYDGENNIVVMAVGQGRFRPLAVEVGPTADGWVRITDGLSGGEAVVTHAQFLIDSEARLQSAVSAMQAGHAHGTTPEGKSPEWKVKQMPINVYAADTNADGHVNLCLQQPHLLQDAMGKIPSCEGGTAYVKVGTAQALLRNAGYLSVLVDPARADANGDGFVYQSPMHWAVFHEGPGNCDICNMTLRRVSLEEARANLLREGYQLINTPG